MQKCHSPRLKKTFPTVSKNYNDIPVEGKIRGNSVSIKEFRCKSPQEKYRKVFPRDLDYSCIIQLKTNLKMSVSITRTNTMAIFLKISEMKE